jgi:nicotinamide mononucleotide adenylyltransferase
VIRHALLENGVDPRKFYLIPIKDIASNAGFAKKVGSLCPAFDSVVAGNDWTKELFGKGQYDIIPLVRNTIPGTAQEISATYVRNTIIETLKERNKKDDPVSDETISLIEQRLADAMDRATLAKLREVGFYDTMKFLTFAVE